MLKTTVSSYCLTFFFFPSNEILYSWSVFIKIFIFGENDLVWIAWVPQTVEKSESIESRTNNWLVLTSSWNLFRVRNILKNASLMLYISCGYAMQLGLWSFIVGFRIWISTLLDIVSLWVQSLGGHIQRWRRRGRWFSFTVPKLFTLLLKSWAQRSSVWQPGSL